MIKLILDDQVKVGWEAEAEIVREMSSIVSPWQGDDLNRISMCAEVFN
jgi:hypothetical protein